MVVQDDCRSKGFKRNTDPVFYFTAMYQANSFNDVIFVNTKCQCHENTQDIERAKYGKHRGMKTN
jgi:hypothetical protein